MKIFSDIVTEAKNLATMDKTRAKTLRLTMKNSVSGIERLKHELVDRTEGIDPSLVKELDAAIKQLKSVQKRLNTEISKATV
jgi:hypothetical protein|tara:strand:+ start:589 stop:834 length:246 start_codon:yes stop_codon:yes gene_type:complete